MFLLVTILAFTVIIAFVVGMRYYKRLPAALVPVVWLCGVWVVAEVYSFALRVNGISNAHVSYILTVIEIYLFSVFFYRVSKHPLKSVVLQSITIIGFAFALLEFILLKTPFNTFSLTFEYCFIAVASLYVFYEMTVNKISTRYLVLTLTILFYTLSSFPYFFAYEWLRISNVALLMSLAGIHSYVHAICYLVLTFVIWKSSSSLSALSSSL